MSIVYISPGGAIALDPSDKRIVGFDWDAHSLASGVQITASSFSLTVIRKNGSTPVTLDNTNIVTGNRKTQVRVDCTTGSLGDRYYLNNQITTDETPVQIKERSIVIRIENR